MEAILNFDLRAFEFVSSIRTGVLDVIMEYYTYLGEAGIIWILIGLALLITKKYRKAGVAVLISLLCMEILNNEVLKELIARPRPFNLVTEYTKRGIYPEMVAEWQARYVFPELVHRPSSFSFPSGHTSSAFTAAMAVWIGTKKAKFGIPMFIAAAIMGFTRLYLQVHYCSDVLGGAVVGIIYALIGYAIANFLYNKFYDKIEAFVKAKFAAKKNADKSK